MFNIVQNAHNVHNVYNVRNVHNGHNVDNAQIILNVHEVQNDYTVHSDHLLSSSIISQSTTLLKFKTSLILSLKLNPSQSVMLQGCIKTMALTYRQRQWYKILVMLAQ